jgi:hypothetical protein
MDPLGFVLENFDAVGRWRKNEGAEPVDASSTFPDGAVVNGPVELRRRMLNHPDQFVGTLTERLLSYAIGRPSEYYDRPAIRAVVREAAHDDYRFSAIILGIVKSPSFQKKVKS